MQTAIGDLLRLDSPYLRDSRFHFSTDSQDLSAAMHEDGATGILESECGETWFTVYAAPWNLSSVYERLA